MSVEDVTPGEPEAALEGPRQSLAEGLTHYLTPAQITALLDEALALKKQARAWCPGCKKAVQVEIADAKAVVDSVSTLLTQGFGRPSGRQHEAEIIVNREVILVYECESGRPCRCGECSSAEAAA